MSGIRLSWEPTTADYVAERRHLHQRRIRLSVAGSMLVATVLPLALLGSEAPPLPLLLWGSLGLAAIVGWAVWRLPVVRVRRAMEDTPDAYPVDTVVLELDAEGLHRCTTAWEVRLTWDAVEAVIVEGEYVFLHLSDVQVLGIPRRVLGSPGDEVVLLDSLRGWQGSAGPPLPEATPEVGRDTWVLRYRLHAEDWVLASGKVQARRMRSRPILLALGLLLPVVLILSLEPWSGQADPMLIALMVGFGVLFVAVGAFRWWLPTLVPWLVRRGLRRHPRRMPVGEVCLGAGPVGGWLQTSRGISRFRWGALTEVINDADALLLMFSEDVAMPVPERAFEAPAEQDRLVQQIVQWRDAEPPRPPSDVEREDRDGMPQVFAPPE